MNIQEHNVRKGLRTIYGILTSLLLFFAGSINSYVQAGVALGATRVVYPAGQKQAQLPVSNNDNKSAYLIQSWIENADGKKDGRFVITPPLFAMKGKRENILRIIDATNKQLPQDRESLFWINVKAIPAMEKEKQKENTLQLAIVSRIKLYYRPADLPLPPEQAAGKLTFSRQGTSLILTNPTPYYLTVVELTVDGRNLESVLVPPLGKASVTLPASAGNNISYRTINDYGALTSPIKCTI